jgi:transposase
MMHEAEDEPLFAERAAGIDIAKAGIEVTVRVPSETRRGGRQQDTRSFRTTRKDLLALADWLRVWGVAKVGMESTGDYWKPVLFLLESEGFDCVLYHAAQVKALPGRPKTDKLDSAWLAKITERGALPGCFVPPEEIRRLRTQTRYRRHLTQTRTAEKSRVEKLLEDAHLKLSSVISDIHGVSGRAMLEAIAAGERNPRDAGPAGPRHHARQDRPAGRSPRLLLRDRRTRRRAGDDAVHHRLLHRADRRADRQDRGAVPAV